MTWGEGKLCQFPSGGVLLLPKGCTLSLMAPPLDMELSQCVCRSSPHARTVWRRQFPALLGKSLWYALNFPALHLNVRSVLWGVGYKRYPGLWWKGRLRRWLSSYALKDVLPWGLLMQCVQDGRMAGEGSSVGGRGAHGRRARRPLRDSGLQTPPTFEPWITDVKPTSSKCPDWGAGEEKSLQKLGFKPGCCGPRVITKHEAQGKHQGHGLGATPPMGTHTKGKSPRSPPLGHRRVLWQGMLPPLQPSNKHQFHHAFPPSACWDMWASRRK